MRKRDFSAGRTWLGAKSIIASVTLRTIASIGSFSSDSNSTLRGVNHSRSLWRARLRRKVIASRRKYGTAAGGAAFTERAMAIVSLSDYLESSAEEQIEVACEGLVFGNRLLDRLLRCRPLIAEIHQSRKHVIHSRAMNRRLCGGDRKIVELIFKFNHQPLSQLFAHARYAGQLSMILSANGLDRPLRREPAEHFDRELGTHTADRDQPPKQPLLFAIEKAEQGDLIFADLGVDVKRYFCAHHRQRCEGGHGDRDVVSHPGSLDDGLAGLLVDQLAAQMSNHCALLSSAERPGGHE